MTDHPLPSSSGVPTILRIRAEFVHPDNGFYSFIGPVAYYTLRTSRFSCEYFCDGMLGSWLFSLMFGRRIHRNSFDYSSIARPFLEGCRTNGRRLLAIGGNARDSALFDAHLRSTYPGLSYRCTDGYPQGGFGPDQLEAIALTAKDFDVVLLALGSPLQERIGQFLVDRGFPGVIITAGAFIAQTAASGEVGQYYPKIINALNLRFLWRLIHEPHTRARFKYVFMFPFSIMFDIARGRVKVTCR